MKQTIKKKTFHERINEFSTIYIAVFSFTIITLITVVLYMNGLIQFVYLRALLFLYVLSLLVLIARVYFIIYVKQFASKIGFKLFTPFYMQPKIEGHYKGNWFQVHYVSKEAGKSPSLLRTYVKLQFKEPKRFDTAMLDKYDDSTWNNHPILTIKHIDRGHKNYLLLKRKLFLFDKKKIHELMDLLLKVAKESEIKIKKK